MLAYSIYFWLVDRPEIRAQFRRLRVSRIVELKRVGTTFEVWIDGRLNARVNMSAMVGVVPIYAALAFWCFWQFARRFTCVHGFVGWHWLALDCAVPSFLIVVFHVGALWALSLLKELHALQSHS